MGLFTEVQDNGPKLLTLVPPSMFGPPEFIHIDLKDTDTTAICFKQLGKGRVAWIPWNLGGMYYRHSLNSHAGLFHDVLNRLKLRAQIKNQCPSVGGNVIDAPERTHPAAFKINLSGHSQTGYFTPVR
jgi:hypothetical protein